MLYAVTDFTSQPSYISLKWNEYWIV